MLAQIHSGLEVDASHGIIVLVTLAGAVLVLATFALGQSNFSAAAFERHRRRTPLSWSPARPGPAVKPAHPPGGLLATPGDLQKRASLRRDGNPVDVLVKLHDGLGDPFSAPVLDRSRGGLRLLVPEAVPVTSLIQVRAPHAPDEVPWVQLQVRRCRPKGDAWEVGCSFTEEQPWSLLLLFG
jgi:hypothetical protein